MQDVKELILLLQHARFHPLQQPGRTMNENPALLRLFDGVSAGRFITDADAAAGLFPGASADHAGFLELKSALRETLIVSIDQFFREIEAYDDVQRAYIASQACWLQVRSLSGQNAAHLALPLANRLMGIAERFGFTSLCLDIALYLRVQTCLREHNSEACARAEQLCRQWRQLFDAEYQAEKRYTDAMALMVDPHISRDTVLQRIKEAATGRRLQSPKLSLYGYLLEILQHSVAHDFEQALQSCDQALRYFQERPYNARTPMQVFYYQRLICCIHLRQFEAGSRSARACLALNGDDFFNRLKINELCLILALHTKEYDYAYQLFSGIRSDPQFDFLPAGHKETWELFGACLSFLQDAGVITAPPMPAIAYDWELMPDNAFSSSETRLAVPRAILHFMMLLLHRRYDELPGLAKRMDDYCTRHLDRERTRRSYLLLKMLVQIAAGHQQRTRIIPLAAGFLAQLKTTPLALANQTEELEILPYEDLWNFALDLLDARN